MNPKAVEYFATLEAPLIFMLMWHLLLMFFQILKMLKGTSVL